jgi:hypothetical protein
LNATAVDAGVLTKAVDAVAVATEILGVPERPAAVPLVFAALFGMSPDASALHDGVVPPLRNCDAVPTAVAAAVALAERYTTAP